ncbi:malto-oligosyltrehalose trehalohydrolase [Bradyrhizobium sp.]|uniref:malto-oligosyltrehalose trehalohydrolase n=1 Tax=Bradyrhizobium sp. TaxID=376 RepID=UPI003C53A333
MLRYQPQKRFGAEPVDGGVHFRLWAPNQDEVSLVLGNSDVLPMSKSDDGWHDIVTARARAGSLYKFRLRDGLEVPDPASRFQPADVHGPSEVVDPHHYRWRQAAWMGRRWEECVIYELHVGAFTRQGSFRGAMDRLDYLADLGITAIEIMPIADFPGNRNWGYDGVLPFAPDSSYGRPDDLKALIDAAHARNIMVFLDVVYNHFGPDGNYLPAYSPIFTEHHKTPWGSAVNFDATGSDLVREFVIQNAIYWIAEFRFDGLRLDAVHAIKDDSDNHILDELASRVRGAAPRRHVHLLLENEENEAAPLERLDGKPIYYTAQWNDDVHHALHAAASGDTSGYYIDYAGRTDRLARALAEGFAFQGEFMAYRGSPRGESSRHLPPTAFVAFIQNHDQVGNRAFGDRITSFAPRTAVRAIISVYLLLPQIPMLFMGEEFAASRPFPFFAHFEPELADAVREGRRAEFAKFPEFRNPRQREQIPDPTSEATYQSATLDWTEAAEGMHAEWAALYRELLTIRHREIVPRLHNISGNCASYQLLGDGAFSVRWTMGDRARLRLVANLASRELANIDPGGCDPGSRLLWSTNTAGINAIDPWSVVWTIEGRGQRALLNERAERCPDASRRSRRNTGSPRTVRTPSARQCRPIPL